MRRGPFRGGLLDSDDEQGRRDPEHHQTIGSLSAPSSCMTLYCGNVVGGFRIPS
jgi:hypothetical protein